MCNCLSFLVENPTLKQIWVEWLQSLALLSRRFQSVPNAEVELLRSTINGNVDDSPNTLSEKRIASARGDGCVDGLLEKCGIHVIRRRRPLAQETRVNTENVITREDQAPICVDSKHEKQSGGKQQKVSKEHDTAQNIKPDLNAMVLNKRSSPAIGIPLSKVRPKISTPIGLDKGPRLSTRTITTNGGDDSFSLFLQQGLKGTNQDSMVVWENFLPSEGATFCGVFDGHGPHGHHVSKNVRDKLPTKVASCWRALQASNLLAARSDSPEKSLVACRGDLDPDSLSIWEETFHSAFNLMDRDLLLDEDVDCVFSGSTAIALVRQGNDIILANVGDSRAVMGVKFEDNLVALQITVDLTPNLPREADRIRRCKGRVLALKKEPFVKRVWLPHENSPGLAMARAFGDYIVKNFGVISVPEVTHRRITKNDQFVVLATDGVWDVLSNDQVVRIVDAAPVRSFAAQAVVDAAVHAWKVKYPDAPIDDCAAVCMFLNSTHPE